MLAFVGPMMLFFSTAVAADGAVRGLGTLVDREWDISGASGNLPRVLSLTPGNVKEPGRAWLIAVVAEDDNIRSGMFAGYKGVYEFFRSNEGDDLVVLQLRFTRVYKGRTYHESQKLKWELLTDNSMYSPCGVNIELQLVDGAVPEKEVTATAIQFFFVDENGKPTKQYSVNRRLGGLIETKGSEKKAESPAFMELGEIFTMKDHGAISQLLVKSPPPGLTLRASSALEQDQRPVLASLEEPTGDDEGNDVAQFVEGSLAEADELYLDGFDADAVKCLEDALKYYPADPGLLSALGFILATTDDKEVFDAERAVRYATKSCERTRWRNPDALAILAAAYAADGKKAPAVDMQKKALQFDVPPEIKSEWTRRLKMYQQGKCLIMARE